MDQELLRNLKLNAVNNPSILHRFVSDLSFWDADGRSSSGSGSTYHHVSRSNSGIDSRGSRSSGSRSGGSRRSKIPSLQEATRMHEREEQEIAAAMKSKSKAVWKSAVDPATGKTYFYDAVSRKTQWHKVRRWK